MKAPNPHGTPFTPFGGRRKGKWHEYTARKQRWIEANPNATSRQIDVAARAIAKELGL